MSRVSRFLSRVDGFSSLLTCAVFNFNNGSALSCLVSKGSWVIHNLCGAILKCAVKTGRLAILRLFSGGIAFSRGSWVWLSWV